MIQINGNPIKVHPPNASSHFEHVNLLGSDFCFLYEMEITIDYQKQTATMQLPE